MSARDRTDGAPGADPARLARAARAHQAGDLAMAQALYIEVLRASPHHVGALYGLGTSYCQQGQPARGVPLFERALALQPDSAEVHCNLSDALGALGHHQAARTHGERAVALDSACAEAHHNLGNALHALARHDAALACYERAVALRPDWADPYCTAGNALYALGRYDEAIARYEQALARNPGFAPAHNNLGAALHARARYEEAIACYDRARALDPAYAEACYNRGNALQALHRCDEAVASYAAALALRPAYAEAHSNLGNALHALNRPDLALPHYEQALAIQPDLADAATNMGLALLALGRYAEGWQPYEKRWRLADVAPLPDVKRPLWLGEEDIAGRHLLIQGEQGLGDAILMARYVPLLEARGVRCWIQAAAALMPLLQRSFPRARVIPVDHCPREAEWRVPIMSLPLAMRTFAEADIPATVPYLRADADQAARWAERLAERGVPAVGLAWRGNPRYSQDHLRSAPLDAMLPLLARSNVQFVVLPHGLTAAESAVLARQDNVIVPDPEHHSFDDLAALVSVLDLVISVDSAPAHLAGALGRPAWVLLSFKPIWCWHLARADSPWYPTARLFRQTASGRWEDVVDHVRVALRARESPRAPGAGPVRPGARPVTRIRHD